MMYRKKQCDGEGETSRRRSMRERRASMRERENQEIRTMRPCEKKKSRGGGGEPRGRERESRG